MSRDYYHRIRQRFVAVVILILLILGGLLSWQSVRERRIIIASAEKSSAGYVTALTEHAGLVFVEVDSSLKELVADIEELGGVSYAASASFHRSIYDRVKNELQFSSIYILDSDGNIVAHSREYPVKPRNLADHSYFKYHRDTPNSALFISSIHISAMDNVPHFSLSRALRGRDGSFAGLVTISIETSYFEQFYKGLAVGSNGRIFLAATNGEILASVPEFDKNVSGEFKSLELFNKFLPNAAFGTRQCLSPFSKDKRIISYKKLDGFPAVVVISLSLETVLEPWYAALRMQVGIAALLYLLACATSLLFLRQLRQLEDAGCKLSAQQEELELKAELLDAASDAILLLDNQGGLVYFNNALETMSGYNREELLLLGLHGIEPPEYAARIQANIEKLFEHGESFFESAYLRKSGSFLPIEVHARITNMNGRTLVLSMVRDISERKEIELQILSAVQEWQQTFDAVEDSVWLLDMDRHVIRANRTSQSLFGNSPHEVAGMLSCEADSGNFTPRADGPFEIMLETGKRATAQLNIDSSWYEISVDPVFDEQGSIVRAVYIAKDINNLKRAEHREQVRSGILERIAGGEPLKELLSYIALSIEKENPKMLCSILLVSDDSKRLLNGAAPSLPDFYNMATHRTKIGEGIGSCGTAAFRRERVIVDDIDSHPFWKDFTPAQEAGLRSCWSEPIISSSGMLLGTFAIYHRTPAIPWEEEIRLIEQAAIFAGLAIERSRADQELRSREERYRTLVDNLPVVVWEADASSSATFISRQVESVYGFSQEEMYAAGPDLWFERIHVEDQKRVEEAYAAFFTGECVFDEEYRIMRKDGEWIWLHDFAYAISTLGNKKVAYGVFADISARKRAELERDELEQQLSQSQKMEAVGHLSGGIAHDFNNLLTPIIIYADMLKRNMPADEKLQHKIDGIIKASHKARDLTQQLLSFGRKQVMQLKILDLNDIITSFHSIIRRTLSESIDIELQLSPQALLVLADHSKLDQVILNLAINAQDSIAETGQIKIETGQVMIDDEYARLHPGMCPGNYAMLVFSDSGCGMNEETMRHIFEPFFTTKQVGHGTGLGLANVYGIVKQHKGYIAAQSKPGSGTTFRIYLPITDQKLDGTSQPEPGNAEKAGEGSILLVEDNEMVRNMTRDLLEGLGYKVYAADHPDMALEIAGDKSLKIDLVITDVVMPGMNGRQLFERITNDRPEICRVLYMSGYTNNIIVTDGSLEEGLHFLQKPFTVDVLMAKVRNLLNQV